MMAVYNRYEGNTGRFRRVEDSPMRDRRTESPQVNRDNYSRGNRGRENYNSENQGRENYNSESRSRENFNRYTMNMPQPRRRPGLIKDLQNLLPNSIGDLETEDLILLLILYLMYRESGDSELLIIMGAMFLL